MPFCRIKWSVRYGIYGTVPDTVLCTNIWQFFEKRRILKYFFLFMPVIQNCFICRPSDSTVSGGCWDLTQDCCDLGIDSQTLKPLG
jgi:hypothetical protein